MDFSDPSKLIEERCYDNWNNYVRSITVNSLLFFHINIISLTKKFSQIEYIVYNSTRNIDIIILTEVNLKENCASLFELPNYNMYTKLRDSRRGGGIIMYIHKKYLFTKINSVTLNFESLLGNIEHI